MYELLDLTLTSSNSSSVFFKGVIGSTLGDIGGFFQSLFSFYIGCGLNSLCFGCSNANTFDVFLILFCISALIFRLLHSSDYYLLIEGLYICLFCPDGILFFWADVSPNLLESLSMF